MMKACAEATRPRNVKTTVSLNPIMVDGTGMCGGCRVSVGGKMKFACVDGPDFNAHEVDFDELMKRQRFFEIEGDMNDWLTKCEGAQPAGQTKGGTGAHRCSRPGAQPIDTLE